MGVILDKKQYSALLREMYISNNGVIDFSKVKDLYSDIMLITATCGRGKTSYALSLGDDGLLAAINSRQHKSLFPIADILPEETLFLVPRKVIKAQQLNGSKTALAAIPNDFSFDYDFSQEERKGYIKLATAHQFGLWIEQGLIQKIPKLIIFDEMHSLFSETIFAEQLSFTLAWLEDNYNDMIKVGLSATPEFLFDYIQEESKLLRFAAVDKNLGSKYKCGKVEVLIKGKAENVLNSLSFDSNNKFIYYTQSASKCYTLSQATQDTAFLISDYNETENKEGILLADIMKEAGVKNYIIENEALPQDINGIFINSACREGMNINDSKVKTIICEATDLITIQQILGRVRNDIDRFIIVCNGNQKQQLLKQIEEVKLFLDEFNSAQEEKKKELLLIRYGRQRENKYLPKVVYKYNDNYYLNNYAVAYLHYKYDSYLQAFNYKESNKLLSVGNKKMLSTEEYISNLKEFTDNDILFEFAACVIQQAKQEVSINKFAACADKWLDKPLAREDKAILCNEIAACRSKGQKASWNTTKELLLAAGYTISQKRVNNKRFDIISL